MGSTGSNINDVVDVRSSGADILRGYAYEQVLTSAYAYNEAAFDKLKVRDVRGTHIGGAIGIIQDTLTVAGAFFYISGGEIISSMSDSTFAKVGAAIVGVKIVSNLVAAGIKQYNSAMDRASQIPD